MTSTEIFHDILVCPQCRSRLLFQEDYSVCTSCETKYCTTETGILDLRLTKLKNIEVQFDVGPTHDSAETLFGVARTNPTPEINYSESDLPIHLTPQMASYIPKAKSKESLCLDLGCGDGQYRKPMEKAGYSWIGFDFENDKAPIWADAHALPFLDDSFEFIISLAVLEHIKYPPVMLREINRVLKPGGIYFGSVANLVPFHDTASYFNMTHKGVWSALDNAGLETEFVFGDTKYHGLRAMANVGLFPGLSRFWAYTIVEPIMLLHRFYWNMRRWFSIPKSSLEWQCLLNTGAFIYRAKKPIDSNE